MPCVGPGYQASPGKGNLSRNRNFSRPPSSPWAGQRYGEAKILSTVDSRTSPHYTRIVRREKIQTVFERGGRKAVRGRGRGMLILCVFFLKQLAANNAARQLSLPMSQQERASTPHGFRESSSWVRPYLVENTVSRPICEVKQPQARSVLRSGMTREPRVLYPNTFFQADFFPPLSFQTLRMSIVSHLGGKKSTIFFCVKNVPWSW